MGPSLIFLIMVLVKKAQDNVICLSPLPPWPRTVCWIFIGPFIAFEVTILLSNILYGLPRNQSVWLKNCQSNFSMFHEISEICTSFLVSSWVSDTSWNLPIFLPCKSLDSFILSVYFAKSVGEVLRYLRVYFSRIFSCIVRKNCLNVCLSCMRWSNSIRNLSFD